MIAFLGLWKYAIYAAVIAAFIGGIVYAKSSYDAKQQAIGAAPYIAAIAAQKREAAILLQAETEKAASITKQWQDYARSSDDEYEKKIAAIRASVNVAGGMRFTDPGRRPSGNCAPANGNNTGAPEKNPSSGQLSGEAAEFLRSEATRADEMMEWAKSCFSFVNRPTIKSQVKAIP